MIHTILVTDDSALDNAILRNYLYPERYNILSALNGREALDMLEGRNIDLILLDMIMPVMDGFEFLKEFSKTPYYHAVPVIISTSLNNNDSIRNVLDNFDIFDYIIKPLDHINRMILINKIRTGIKYRLTLKELADTNRENKI